MPCNRHDLMEPDGGCTCVGGTPGPPPYNVSKTRLVECEFKEHCGGGHTTAQHHLHVNKRIIAQECGHKSFYSIKDAVDRDAAAQERKAKILLAIEKLGEPTRKDGELWSTWQRRIALYEEIKSLLAEDAEGSKNANCEV
jgi:hypothetical protein